MIQHDKSWGFLGKPPKDIMDGTSNRIALFKKYCKEMDAAAKIKNTKMRASRMAEVKAKYNRDFPKDE